MSPIFLNRFDKSVDGRVTDVLVAFVGTAKLDGRALAAAIEVEIERGLAPDELIIIVRSSTFDQAAAALLEERQGKALRERLAGRSAILLIAYDSTGSPVDERVIVAGDRSSGVTLREIVRRGVTAIFRANGGFVEASASYHFANPSGRHTDRFMRLSNILVRQAEISFVALSVMPLVPADARQAYIDTPSLYSVVSAINEQWRTLAPERPSLEADNFGSYGRVEEHRFTDLDRSIAIISASSSGSLAAKLAASGFRPSRVIHALFLGNAVPELRIATDLARDASCNPRGYTSDRKTFDSSDCQLCRQNSVAISLKGDQFDISGPQPAPLVVKRVNAGKALTGMMERVVGRRALAVTSGSRQFEILPGALASEKSPYRDRLDFFVRRHVPAGVAKIIISDQESKALADHVRSIAGFEAPVLTRTEVESLPVEDGDGAILVVAGAIGSGRALLDISRDLRNVAPKSPIIYLVGVAKPENQAKADTLRRSLVQTDLPVSHLVEVVEQMVLPANSAPNAWIDELAFLTRYQSQWPAPMTAALRERRARLIKASEPMQDDLFVRNAAELALPLREGFVFWPSDLPNDPDRPHTQADVFFTVASVLQHLRSPTDAPSGQALSNNWLQQTLLSPENFGRFNDGIIQASLLRAARPAEMDYRDDVEASMEAARIIRRIIESADRTRGEAAAEFAIALGTGRMRLCSKDYAAVLAPQPDAPPMVSALLALAKIAIDPSQKPPRRRRESRTK